MKKFKFSLQTLLDLTISLEKEQKNKLANINNELNVLNSKKNEIISKINNQKAYITSAKKVSELVNSNYYLTYLKERLANLNIEINMKEKEKTQIQKELIETMTKRKSYEKLREKQLDLYKKELAAEDAKELDNFISANGGE